MASTFIWIPKRLVEIGLLNVSAQIPREFIRYSEGLYDERITNAARQIIDGGTKIVMLTGPSASGKTTTAKKIAQKIKAQGINIGVISLDNFFKNIEEYPRLQNGTPDYESVDALDLDLINNCLLEVASQGKTVIPEFDFCTEHRKSTTQLVDIKGGVLIVEGIHALNPRLTHAVPRSALFKIYAGMREEYSHGGQRILSTRDIRLARRMVRDIETRGHTIEKTMEMWPEVCKGEDRNIKVFKTEADILLDTSFSYEICCLAPYIHAMRAHVSESSAHYEVFKKLCENFTLCNEIDRKYIPNTSMLKEFLL